MTREGVSFHFVFATNQQKMAAIAPPHPGPDLLGPLFDRRVLALVTLLFAMIAAGVAVGNTALIVRQTQEAAATHGMREVCRKLYPNALGNL